MVWALREEWLVGVRLGRDLKLRQGNLDFPVSMRGCQRF